MSELGKLDARVDFLTLRIEQLHDRLLLRAEELETEALTARGASAAIGSQVLPREGVTHETLSAIASEFREIAGVLE
jgi:hypothetical protein